MNDSDIRPLLFSRLGRRKGYHFNKVIEEAPLLQGSIRADVVYCSNVLECFEIKGQNDNLSRLVSQGWQYEQSFDRVSLVCAEKHLQQALSIIPEWWGVLCVNQKEKLVLLRQAKPNPNVNICGLVDILNNEEAKLFLNAIGHGKGITKLSHHSLKTRIQKHSNPKEIRKWIVTNLPDRNIKSKLSNMFSVEKSPTLSYA